MYYDVVGRSDVLIGWCVCVCVWCIVACEGKKANSSIMYFVGFVELPCLSAPLGNVSQYKVCTLSTYSNSFYKHFCQMLNK